MAHKSFSVQRALTRAASHAKKGELQQAYQLYKMVLDKFPKNAQASNGILGLRNMQQPQLAQVPPQAKIDEIASLHEEKQYKLALGKVQELVKVYPRFPRLYNIAGVILAEVGQWENALKAYQQALGLKPDYAEAHYNHAIALQHFGKLEQAISGFRNAIKVAPDYFEAHNNLGNALKDQGKLNEAILSFQRAIAIMPNIFTAYSNLGNCFKDLGRNDEAVESYKKTIELQPDFIEGYLALGSLIKYSVGDPHIAKMKSLLDEFDGDDITRVRLYFALAKAYEDIGDINTTFELLLAGNRLRKQHKEYSINLDAAQFANIRSFFTTEIPNVPTKIDALETRKKPIFIVGMPRSGTTLTEQILASHSRVFGAGELSTLGNTMKPVLADVAQHSTVDNKLINTISHNYQEGLNELSVPEEIIVDKMPLNFRWVGFILAAFPDAKIINLNRDPMATGWSIFKYNFSSSGNRYAHDLQDIGEFYKLYVDLMEFWREKFPGKIYDLNYEALTEDQEGETRKLLEYCGLDWEAGCLDFHNSNRIVKTVSSSQVRKKMYKGSSQAWRKYEKHLGPLLDALDDKDV